MVRRLRRQCQHSSRGRGLHHVRLTLPAHQQVAHQHLPVLARAVRRWQIRLAARKRCNLGIICTISITESRHVISDNTTSNDDLANRACSALLMLRHGRCRAVPAGPGGLPVRAQLLQEWVGAAADAGLVPGAGRAGPRLRVHLLRLPHAAARAVTSRCGLVSC